jgi:hypothetical protein
MTGFLIPLYFIVGLAQLFAIQDWLKYTFEIGGLLSFIGALFVTYIPLVGSILGVLGAHNYWGWSWFWSSMLFFWYVPFFGVAVVIGALSSSSES